MEFKQRISRAFPALFPEPIEGYEPEEDYSAAGQFAKKWGWFGAIFQLSQSDVNRFEETTKQKLIQCLMYLDFEKDKTRIENKR